MSKTKNRISAHSTEIGHKDGLPDGWTMATVKEISHSIQYGYTASSDRELNGPRFLRITDIQGGKVNWDTVPSCEISDDDIEKYRLAHGDLVFARTGATTGKSFLIQNSPEAVFASYLIRLRMNKGFEPRFVGYFFQSLNYWRQIEEGKQGIGQPNVNAKTLGSVRLPIAPLPEQKRIVAKIEELFSDLDAGVSALERARANLRRYRASVLKSAVEGRLTKKWRAAKPGVEPASELLARILRERRQRWEQQQLATYESKGKKPPKNWQSKYKEPAAPDTANLPELPDGWCWATPEQLAADEDYSLAIGPFGSNLKVSDYTEDGVPLIFVRHIRSGDFGLDGAKPKYVSPSKAKELDAHSVDGGDVLITKMGEPPGDATLYPENMPRAIITADCIKFRPAKSLGTSRYFVWAINSQPVQKQIEGITRGVAQKKVSLGRFEKVSIPLAPVSEQDQFVLDIETLTSVTDRTISQIELNLVRAETLRQSILKRAFDGKIVPQDPNEEPASLLLERLGLSKAKPSRNPSRTTPPTAAVKHASKESGNSLEANDFRETPNLEPYTRQKRRGLRFRRIQVPDVFRSLENLDAKFNRNASYEGDLSPICFVGLNGSGKSNLIEFVGAILCDVELSLLNYKRVNPSRLFTRPFRIEYEIASPKAPICLVIIEKKETDKLPRFSIEIEGESFSIEGDQDKLELLPSRIVAYSSGHNETISVPFLRSQAYYAQEVLAETQELVEEAARNRTIFLDYDFNSTILIANYIFCSDEDLALFTERLRIEKLDSFAIVYRLKRRAGSTVKLTETLNAVLALFRDCATKVEETKDGQVGTFVFDMSEKTRDALRQSFVDPMRFFNAVHRWSQLNSLSQTKRERDYYLSTLSSTDMLSRPPQVSRENRVFSIEKVKLTLTHPPKTIAYEGLSDGEHQYMQVVGSVLLFSEPGTLFLFDEPETHFNPKWRRHFVDDINSFTSVRTQEMFISTHSPFVVSGCHREGVFRFKRDDDVVKMKPARIETFGTSFELLLSELFDLEAMIAEQAVEELREAMKGATSEEVLAAATNFGESMEKRFLFSRAAELREQEGKQ